MDPQLVTEAPTFVATPLIWASFIAIIVALLALDLGVLRKEDKKLTTAQAFTWCVFWVGLAAVFNLVILYYFGSQKALEFLTGYIVEQALSVDNIFVFLVLFSFFAVKEDYQHRVLFYGILGAIVMRGLFVILGSELLSRFHWTIYIFGAILIISGIKLLKSGDEEMNPEKNPIIRFFRKVVPLTPDYHEQKFMVRIDGKLFATPLLLVLVAIECTDLVFAVDSVPAIFAITKDPFIVFSSNIFAILGLRSYFFLLSGVIGTIAYLKMGLSVVLMYVGCKMLLHHIYPIPTVLSLGIIVGILAVSIGASFLFPPKKEETPETSDTRA
jgi:tellurite resistance protein TerC